ncbi:Hypothetical Protein FCC1311_102442 [Hondaea fermentalgiana]|uniref:GxGYxYP putative glycoside hydrolase C-terminal domain-containing protein n=1 Tax=Hondaea fermentalgiana TaxID=2315210 RepID=A0A2R5GZV5_9STRA|nr:Hypothetical Protein FCC1311_102442 [Hondaea fermentalgiana]|eukprot:GBG34021.1 Hypothetical Protein FCC1311_102442 [Hondaea fermentalgiana]
MNRPRNSLVEESSDEEVGLVSEENVVLIADCLYAPSVGATVGLMNRKGPVADCLPYWPQKLGYKIAKVEQSEFVKRGLQEKLFKGRVLFDRSDTIGENLALSAAGIHDLLPVADGDPALEPLSQDVEALPVAFDFRENRTASLPGGFFRTDAAATQWTLEHLVPLSNKHKITYRPPQTKLMPFIVMERTVAVFVSNIAAKCTEYNLAPFKALAELVARRNGLKPFLDLTSSGYWDESVTPLTMYGYSAGMYESTGFCTRDKTMGVAASDIADSLSFLIAVQRAEATVQINTTQTLQQKPPQDGALQFNASKVYVAHVVSDGDNLSLLAKSTDNLEKRRKVCTDPKRTTPCPPRAWTVSGQTQTVAAAIRTMYKIAESVQGADSFILPPSGATYFYPAAAVDKQGLLEHRDHTVEVASNLGIEATIVWDFFFNFLSSQHREYIRSFIGTPIKAVFWSAAPWLLSPNEKTPFVKLGYKSDQVYRDPADPTRGVVLFSELTRWNDISGKDSNNGKGLKIDDMVRLVAQQPAGSLNFIYDISWGINPLIFDKYAAALAAQAPDVELVDHRTLIRLARQKHGLQD